MEGFAGEMKASFHMASHTMQKAAAAQTQDPWRPPPDAETPQGLLKAPAAGEVLGGAGMWPP